MKPSRGTQPYRKRSPFRRPGRALSAMLRGRTGYGKNPMDQRRRAQKRRRRRSNRRVY